MRISRASLAQPPLESTRGLATNDVPSRSPDGEQPSHIAERVGSPEHRFIIDPETQDLVFQRLNPKTGDVVRQFPDQVLLSIRAYNQATDGVPEHRQLGSL